MLECSVKGCGALASETLGDPKELKQWAIFRACRCGAYNTSTPKSCTCSNDGPLYITYWPNLDWYALGGVEQVTLCPDHRVLVAKEIMRQRGIDPSMNAARLNRGNVH